MAINYKLLPVKAHFFFFMAGMGPVLPFLPVFGKQLGISEVVMGIITSILPIMFLLAKPVFGYAFDLFRGARKALFLALLMSTTVFFVLLTSLPLPAESETRCNGYLVCQNQTSLLNLTTCQDVCSGSENSSTCENLFPECKQSCNFTCLPVSPSVDHGDNTQFYKGMIFWLYVIFMSLGSIGFNVINSISDTICFDVLGDGQEKKYGKQRVWGTIGFGIFALLGGYAVDVYSGDSGIKDYTPAFSIALVCMICDVICCFTLKLPPLPRSENIVKDMVELSKHPHIAVFLAFTVLVGICDSFIIYYLFWFLEDLAIEHNYTENIKLLEGITIAAETLGAEVIFFIFSGKILARIGYGYCLSLCFFAYGMRLGLLSLLSNPWWVIPIELAMQGPTYALTYTTIVAYASAISPPGTSATTQGIVAGLDDGLGYALGSLSGGFLYRWLKGNNTLRVYSALAFVCSLAHTVLYLMFRHPSQAATTKPKGVEVEYKSPELAKETTVSAS
ncbi:major facilitator superfamily domain-containing protein 6-like [Nilaparvata lugens]|uniref:major facilitator superfamily domain-containing protein 6-like n=1 Tax=Nilaparvata lugens TaxID=108931 RepID=UPI00193D715D|nr:major facilitator superfamily domain-containing protein 6-like [Nilaparvata lugens]